MIERSKDSVLVAIPMKLVRAYTRPKTTNAEQRRLEAEVLCIVQRRLARFVKDESEETENR